MAEFYSAANAKLFSAPISMAFKSPLADVSAVGGTVGTVKIVAAVLVIIMMVTTFMTSRQMILKTGWSEDPQQKMIQRLMLYGIPVSLLLSGWAFPIGVIIYWVTQNIFSFGQQFWVLHKYPPPLAAGATASKSPAKATTVAPVVEVEKSGLFRRRKEEESAPVQPVVDTSARAPRPGAKPSNPKKGGRKR